MEHKSIKSPSFGIDIVMDNDDISSLRNKIQEISALIELNLNKEFKTHSIFGFDLINPDFTSSIINKVIEIGEEIISGGLKLNLIILEMLVEFNKEIDSLLNIEVLTDLIELISHHTFMAIEQIFELTINEKDLYWANWFLYEMGGINNGTIDPQTFECEDKTFTVSDINTLLEYINHRNDCEKPILLLQ